ncbi:MAG: zinc-binding alcohol dehydrogenase [Chloroflexota bacterium]|nr:zinc-binding alcohol dehydrogenase [Chloroflexota bacterium]
MTSRTYDLAWGAVMPRPPEEALAAFPMPLGNMAVGVVTEIGTEVSRFRTGDRVFGHFPIRETQTVDQSRADLLPAGLSPEAALCLDPLVMALAMRDAGISLGDRIAVFGLGAIGQCAVQLPRWSGADRVIAVDPIENRRELAQRLGVDVVLDPTESDGDAGLAIRRLTGSFSDATPQEPARRIVGGYAEQPSQLSQLGVDVAVETSGSAPAVHQTVRATRFGGTVCVISFYGREAAGLHLGEEVYINRLTLVSTRAQSLPMRDAPAWTLERLVTLGLDWLTSDRVIIEGIITPIVSFEDSVDAYRMIDEHPERSIKLGVRFP